MLQLHTIRDISYQEIWDFQEVLMQKLIQSKRNKIDLHESIATHHLIFCEHKPVYTLGKSGSLDHLLISEEDRKVHKFEFHKINRGGDITYHGPGQWTIYPIIDLECYYRDVHRYVRNLEEIVISLLKHYEIDSGPVDGYTGVWVGDKLNRKICAIGVHLSRWVSMHGLALNVQPNLDHFNHIIPCGIPQSDRTVTAINTESSKVIEMESIQKKFVEIFLEYFPASLI